MTPVTSNPKNPLSPAAVGRVFTDRLSPPDMTLLAVHPHMRRLKGEDGLLDSFELSVQYRGAAYRTYVSIRTASPERLQGEYERIQGRKSDPVLPLPLSWLDTEAGRLFYPFPKDRTLKHVSDLMDMRQIRRVIAGPAFGESSGRVSKSASRVSVASYRPERRIVLSWNCVIVDGLRRRRERFYVRRYAAQAPSGRAELHGVLKEVGVRTPKPVCALDKHTIVEARLKGRGLIAGRPLDHDQVGEVLARVHTARAPTILSSVCLDGLLFAAQRCARDLAIVDTLLGSVALSLVDRLASKRPTDTDFKHLIHGDAHDGQFLFDGNRVDILDWDRAAQGPPELDLANYCAHLLKDHPASAAIAYRALLNGYRRAGGSVNLHGLSWYRAVALLRVINLPFRWYVHDWRSEAQRLLSSAQNEVAHR